MTIYEAARYLGKTHVGLYQAIQRNALVATKDAKGRWAVTKHALRQYQKTTRRGRTPSPSVSLPTGVRPSELARQLGVSRQRVHQLLNREKHRARNAVGIAVRKGALQRPARCEYCGKARKRIEAHHPDYAKPLDIQWLCTTCHSMIHPHGPR